MRTRLQRLNIRLDDTEAAALDLLAARWQTTRSDLVRGLVMISALRELEPEPEPTGDFARDVDALLAWAERTGNRPRVERPTDRQAL